MAALVTGGTSVVAGGALTVGCAVVLGTITVVAGAAAWVGGSAAGKALANAVKDQKLGDQMPQPQSPPTVPKEFNPPRLGPQIDDETGEDQLIGRCRSFKCRVGVGSGLALLLWAIANGGVQARPAK